jgi:hypothetical protein
MPRAFFIGLFSLPKAQGDELTEAFRHQVLSIRSLETLQKLVCISSANPAPSKARKGRNMPPPVALALSSLLPMLMQSSQPQQQDPSTQAGQSGPQKDPNQLDLNGEDSDR